MLDHRITVTVYIGKRHKLLSWYPPLATSDTELDKHGSVWGERQVLQLGAHFNLYKKHSRWRLNNQMGSGASGLAAHLIQAARDKLPAPSVAGNFGEVITILALESMVPARPLRVCHLCPVNGAPKFKCPDLLLESTPLRDSYESFRKQQPPAAKPPALPDLMPGECKNSDFTGALRQLAEYWRTVGASNPSYGFGLISNISYRTSPFLNLHILALKDKAQLDGVLAKIPTDGLRAVSCSSMRGVLYGFTA